LLRGQLHLELVLELGLSVELARLLEADLELVVGHRLHDLLPGEYSEAARVTVQLHPDIVGQPHGFLGSGQEGRLHRLEENLFADPLLAADLLDDVDQVFIGHGLVAASTTTYRFRARGRPNVRSSRALVTSARGTSVVR